ncbi:hypothetical protein IMSAGC020_02423 [Lachnospiraceae bacterium]|nr:hypothetical protein IMSAGC020_02423 [Lachnospiraceae bacterium]
MIGKFIVFGVVSLMVVLTVWLLHDSDFVKYIIEYKGKIISVTKGKKEEKEVEISNGPVLWVRFEGQKNYYKAKVDKKEFRIGRGKKNNLSISSKTVEEKHAIIYKRQKGSSVFYELVNYAKSNPVEYYNKQKQVYEYLGYKDGVKLDAREAFYIGNNKIIVSIPVITHSPTFTEYVGFNRDGEIKEHSGSGAEQPSDTQVFQRNSLKTCV